MAEATSVSSGSGRGGSPSFVVAGATVTCKEGSKEAHLMNMSFGSVDIGMMQGLTKDDKAIQENDFGICKKLSEKYEKEKDEKKEIQCKPEFLEWSNTESLTTFTTIETLTLNSKLSCDCTSPESISILDSGQGGGGSNGNSILPQLNDAALGMNPLQQYGYLAVGSSGLLIMVKGAGGAIVSAVGWPVLLAGGVIFVFYGLSKINNGVTVMQPPAWAMGSTGVTTIGKVYDQDGNVISSIPGYTDPYGNVTTQNPAKDVGNGITLGPRPEDMAAGGMYTGISAISIIKPGDKTANGRIYTKHGSEQANDRNFDSTIVDNIINNNTKNRVKEIGDKGEAQWRYQDNRGNTVITDEWVEKIVTVYSYPKSANKGKYIPK
nr:PAAR-like protein [Enterococcus sp. BWB1-3]